MRVWGSAFQLKYYFPGEERGWPEKPPVFTGLLQARSAPRAAPALLSPSPPTHSTDFHFGKRCGKKQARQRRGSATQREPPGCRTPPDPTLMLTASSPLLGQEPQGPPSMGAPRPQPWAFAFP